MALGHRSTPFGSDPQLALHFQLFWLSIMWMKGFVLAGGGLVGTVPERWLIS